MAEGIFKKRFLELQEKNHKLEEELRKLKEKVKLSEKMNSIGLDRIELNDFTEKYLEPMKGHPLNETEDILSAYQLLLNDPPVSFTNLSAELKQRLEKYGISVQLFLDKIKFVYTMHYKIFDNRALFTCILNQAGLPESEEKKLSVDFLSEPLPDEDFIMCRILSSYRNKYQV